ncbi:MAG: hypothetical protein AAGJ79_12045, partial [Verrucomicrobiota bacterium]
GEPDAELRAAGGLATWQPASLPPGWSAPMWVAFWMPFTTGSSTADLCWAELARGILGRFAPAQRPLPSIASVLAELTFSKDPSNWKMDATKRRFPLRAVLVGVGALSVTLFASSRLFTAWWSEPIGAVEVERLNHRYVPRSIERLKELKDAYDDNQGWLPSRTLLGELANTFQALTTDVGESIPDLILSVKTEDGNYVDSGAKNASLEAEEFFERWNFPSPIVREGISGLRLQSRIEFIGGIGHTVTEQELTVENDWYRGATSVWFGRLFQFTLIPADAQASVRKRKWYGSIAAAGLFVTLVGISRALVRPELKG